ncbi:YciI family protein [Flindersiella endophytica]
MTRYLLSLYQPDSDPPVDGDLHQIQRDLDALEQRARTAGAWLFSGGLQPPATAGVVRSKGGQVVTTDGPYVEGKEHIGGFVVIEAADGDAANEWAGQLSEAATLPVEVWPIR